MTAMAMCLGWQMAGASLPFLCCCTGQAGTPGELKSKGLSPVDESTWEQDTPKCLWLLTSLCQSRYAPKHLWL